MRKCPARSTSEPGLRHRPSRARLSRSAVFTAEREAAALVFVERHHPELGSLLERLKPMNEAEYEKAIVELFSLSETLADLSQRDPKRHELAVEAWKARSRVQLLTAQMAGEPARRAERERALLELPWRINLMSSSNSKSLSAKTSRPGSTRSRTTSVVSPASATT